MVQPSPFRSKRLYSSAVLLGQSAGPKDRVRTDHVLDRPGGQRLGRARTAAPRRTAAPGRTAASSGWCARQRLSARVSR